MYVWLNLKTIKFYIIKLTADFYWQPSYLLGERAPFRPSFCDAVTKSLAAESQMTESQVTESQVTESQVTEFQVTESRVTKP
jgi:hypothetical protein